MILARKWLALLALILGCAWSAVAAAPARTPALLVFTYSTGFRHNSIEVGAAAVEAMGRRNGWTVVTSADPDIFASGRLDRFDAIVLLSNTTDPKNPASEWWTGSRREALQAFVRRGGGIVGVHAAADSHGGWPWYGRMIGGRFRSHPQGTPAGQVTLVDRSHPAARGLASPQRRVDEWYYYEDHDPTTQLIATFDPQSIGAADVNSNPIAWSHRFEGGRVFYTGMGHTAESYAVPWFLRHLEGGISWAIGR